MASKAICPQVILVCTEILSSVRALAYTNQKLVLFNKLVEFNQYMSFYISKRTNMGTKHFYFSSVPDKCWN